MSLWWLQPGRTDQCCAVCGARIYPEGDPDWGKCVQCFDEELHWQQQEAEYQQQLEEEDRLALAQKDSQT
jgi:hypothetical protein